MATAIQALGAEVTQGRGSRVRIHLKGLRAVFHEPHPEKETDKGALRSVREFLENAGITQGEDNADLLSRNTLNVRINRLNVRNFSAQNPYLEKTIAVLDVSAKINTLIVRFL